MIRQKTFRPLYHRYRSFRPFIRNHYGKPSITEKTICSIKKEYDSPTVPSSDPLSTNSPYDLQPVQPGSRRDHQTIEQEFTSTRNTQSPRCQVSFKTNDSSDAQPPPSQFRNHSDLSREVARTLYSTPRCHSTEEIQELAKEKTREGRTLLPPSVCTKVPIQCFPHIWSTPSTHVSEP